MGAENPSEGAVIFSSGNIKNIHGVIILKACFLFMLVSSIA
jgi:hypothetical protein